MRWKEGCIALGLAAITGGLFFLQNRIIFSYNRWPVQSLYSLLFDIAVCCMWVALAYPIYLVVQKNRLEEHGWLRLVAVHVTGSFAFGYAHGYLTYGLLWAAMTLFHQPLEPLASDRMAILFMHFGKFFSYSVILVLCYGLDFWQRSKWHQIRSAHIVARLSQTNFEMIRMQLSPRMLFATLDSIASRMEDELESADSTIERLGDYLRLLLQTAGSRRVPLHEEVAITQVYLELWQMRFERELPVEWNIDAATLGDLVPKDLLRSVFEDWCETWERSGEIAPIAVASSHADQLLEVEIRSPASDGFFKWELQSLPPGVRAVAREGILRLRISASPHEAKESDALDHDPSPDAGSQRARRSIRRVSLTGREKLWLWNLAVWSAFAVVFFARVIVVAARSGFSVDTTSLLWSSMQFYVWALLTPWILTVVRSRPMQRGRFLQSVPVLILQNMLLWVPFMALQGLCLYAETGTARQTLSDTIFNFQYATQTMTYWGIVVFEHAFLWRNEWMKDRVQSARLETQLFQARLTALKMQLHPHFVFNTLNSISELMRQDVVAAEQMIQRLKDFLTLTLGKNAPFEVTLAEELEFLKNYLAIQQVRFQDRLRVEMQIQDGVSQRMVPNLILQPIVENAIRYGISTRRETGEILIRANQHGGHLRLEVRDDGPGMRKSFSEGVGLSNTRKRLKQFYGDDYFFELSNVPGGGMSVTLEIPAA